MLFQGVLFKADFNKTLSSITQIAHVNSQNLAIYGKKENMDDARFEEIESIRPIGSALDTRLVRR